MARVRTRPQCARPTARVRTRPQCAGPTGYCAAAAGSGQHVVAGRGAPGHAGHLKPPTWRSAPKTGPPAGTGMPRLAGSRKARSGLSRQPRTQVLEASCLKLNLKQDSAPATTVDSTGFIQHTSQSPAVSSAGSCSGSSGSKEDGGPSPSLGNAPTALAARAPLPTPKSPCQESSSVLLRCSVRLLMPRHACHLHPSGIQRCRFRQVEHQRSCRPGSRACKRGSAPKRTARRYESSPRRPSRAGARPNRARAP